ncbi:MAG: CoA-binding protein [bacterium]|nr:CoA-binding protein [bacterium]
MEKLFNPKSVVLIGATDRPGSVGLGIAKNLLSGKNKRKIFFINPNSKKVLNQKTFASILDIKEKIDLAIIAVPVKFVKQVCIEVCQTNVGSCIIISSGFAEAGREGAILQKEIKELFLENSISLVGPNCLGVINPSVALNASFAPEMPKQGSIAFLSQSGALIDSIIDKSLLENFGFSLMVSYGNEAGLSLNDFLKIANDNKDTKVIAVYLEEIKKGPEFIKIANEITKNKPIVILKGGKTQEGRLAVQSHTASLAGNEKIYAAAFQKAGVIEVETIRDLFLISQALSIYSTRSAVAGWPASNVSRSDAGWPAQSPAGNEAGWAILTNGGAVGVITADWCSRFGVKLVKISQNNPWDILGDASSEKYQTALISLLRQKEISGVIFCQTLQTMTDPLQNAKVIIEAQKQFLDKPILPLFLGGKITKKGSDFLSKNGLLNFNEPRDIALCAKFLENKTASHY